MKERFTAFPDSIEHVHCAQKDVFFTHPEAKCIDIEYPSKLEQMPFFARSLATIGYEDKDFEGALLWFTQWEVWNPSDEGIGYRIIEAINKGSGQPISFEAGPGHEFRADQLQEAVGMLLQPMVFGWDAIYLPRWSYGGHSQFFVHVSHDSFVSVVTLTSEFHDKVFGQLKKLEFHAKPGHELQARRFCHMS
jgi:hypothetical protein